MENGKTPFTAIYDSFLTRVTSDMYMESTEIDVIEELQSLLLTAIHRFEFPKFDIYDYEEGVYTYLGTYKGVESDYEESPAMGWVGGFFNAKLTAEEINILSLSMVIEWFTQQLAVTENTRMKFSGADFKFTSQANHMAKLKVMIDAYEKQCFHAQRVYCRRARTKDGMRSTMGMIMETPTYGYGIE